MIDFYLLTGFLGAGKTTCLQNFIRILAPKRLHILINEFGAVGVDSVLLQGVDAVLSEVNNGSIFCSCRFDQFENVLENILQNPPEAVVVEASGLSDPTAIGKILADPRYKDFCYKGAICIVDALRFHKVLATARVCAKQLAVSDIILINKTDLATPEQIAEVRALIQERYPAAVIHETTFGQIDPAWLKALGRQPSGEEDPHDKDLTLQKNAVTINSRMTRPQLEGFIKLFVEDTYRLKGFVCLADGLYYVDCVGPQINIVPWAKEAPPNTGVLVALAGRGMNPRRAIKKAIEWYPDCIDSME